MEINLTQDNFEEIITNSEKPILIDFWASWCGPCKLVAPVIEKVAAERPDITVCKVNVDEQEQLAIKYEIRSIPTLILIKNKIVTGKAIGYRDYDGVIAFIDGE